MQLRALGQFEEARVSVKVFLVMELEQAGSSQLAIRSSEHAAQPTQRDHEGKAPGDPITDVEIHEIEKLGGRGVELIGRTVVAIPVEYEVRGENAAAGHRCNVGDVGKNAGVAEKTDQAEVIETGSEAASRQGEADSCH